MDLLNYGIMGSFNRAIRSSFESKFDHDCHASPEDGCEGCERIEAYLEAKENLLRDYNVKESDVLEDEDGREYFFVSYEQEDCSEIWKRIYLPVLK